MNAQQAPWEYIREAVAAADSAGLLATTNSNWDERNTKGRCKRIPHGAKALLITFIGDHATNPEDGTATIKFSAYRSGGPAQVIGTYTIVIGGKLVVMKPGRIVANATAKWAESVVGVSEYWITAPEIIGALADNVACLAVKTYGFSDITAEITALSAGIILDVLMAPIDQMPY